jgi:hypothetical protein
VTLELELTTNIVGQFPFGDSGALNFVFNLIYLFIFIMIMLYGQKLQVLAQLREVGGAVERLKTIKDEARRTVIEAIKEVSGSKSDPAPRVDQLIEYFTTIPISLDPAGIVPKIEHIVDIRDQRFRNEVKIMSPGAREDQISNLEGALDVTLGLNTIYRIVRHYYIMSKNTMSLYVLMQIQMALPLIMREAEALAGAVKAFVAGQPIGDGAGALVAAKLMYKKENKSIAKDIVMAETELDERKIFVLKAEGPGANVGKPGDAIKKLIEDNGGKVSMVIMIDAASKLEGENTGETAEGVGTAIGGIGVDEFKIEDVLTKYGVPINSIIIKESTHDAITPMKKEIVDATDIVIAKVRRLILEHTKKGDTVILAGIGNTIGIGQ